MGQAPAKANFWGSKESRDERNVDEILSSGPHSPIILTLDDHAGEKIFMR